MINEILNLNRQERIEFLKGLAFGLLAISSICVTLVVIG